MRILRLLGIGVIWWILPCAFAVAHPNLTPRAPETIHIKMVLETERIHVFFTGKVQGVGFRQSTKDFANALSIKGWVKNLDDSRVEMIAEGNDDDLQLLIGKLRREFQIEKIEMRRERADGRFKGFDIVD